LVEIPDTVTVPIDRLRVDDQNPNRMTEKQHESLRESINRFGFIIPIITNEDYLIADGEQRWTVAKSLGMTEVPVVRLPVSDVDRRLLRQVLNKLKGEHQRELDSMEFLRIVEAGEKRALQELIGVSERQIENRIEDLRKPRNTDLLPEVRETDVQRGDIFQLGNHRLLCGDATSKDDYKQLIGAEKINCVFTDPPYNVDYSSKNEFLNLYDKGNRIQTPIRGDNVVDLYSFLYDSLINLSPYLSDYNAIYITFAGSTLRDLLNAFYDAGFTLHQILVWVKNNIVLGRVDYKSQHEFIVYGWNGKHAFYGEGERSVWMIDKPLRSELHPVMKPIELCKRAIYNSSLAGEKVLDVFGGSGSTLIAAEETDRTCYMMEIEPHYCQVIIDRWENYTGEKAVKIAP
jgi:DNA modification methylase